MLANDVSSSMAATDVAPTRLGAAKRAAERFLQSVPDARPRRAAGVRPQGRPCCSRRPPTTRGPLPRSGICARSGGTAIGDAIQTALRELKSLRAQDGKRPPAAIVLLSDGGSNVGSTRSPRRAQAAAEHIPIYTVALGTPDGTIAIKRGSQTVDRARAARARSSSPRSRASRAARAFTAADTAG